MQCKYSRIYITLGCLQFCCYCSRCAYQNANVKPCCNGFNFYIHVWAQCKQTFYQTTRVHCHLMPCKIIPCPVLYVCERRFNRTLPISNWRCFHFCVVDFFFRSFVRSFYISLTLFRCLFFAPQAKCLSIDNAYTLWYFSDDKIHTFKTYLLKLTTLSAQPHATCLCFHKIAIWILLFFFVEAPLNAKKESPNFIMTIEWTYRKKCGAKWAKKNLHNKRINRWPFFNVIKSQHTRFCCAMAKTHTLTNFPCTIMRNHCNLRRVN